MRYAICKMRKGKKGKEKRKVYLVGSNNTERHRKDTDIRQNH